MIGRREFLIVGNDVRLDLIGKGALFSITIKWRGNPEPDCTHASNLYYCAGYKKVTLNAAESLRRISSLAIGD